MVRIGNHKTAALLAELGLKGWACLDELDTMTLLREAVLMVVQIVVGTS